MKTRRPPGPPPHPVEVTDDEVPQEWRSLSPPEYPPLHEMLTYIRADVTVLHAVDPWPTKDLPWLQYFQRVIAHTRDAVQRHRDLYGKFREVQTLIDLLPVVLTPQMAKEHPWIFDVLRDAFGGRVLDIRLREEHEFSTLDQDLYLLRRHMFLRDQRFGKITAGKYKQHLEGLVESYLSSDLANVADDGDDYEADLPENARSVANMRTMPQKSQGSPPCYRLSRRQVHLLLWQEDGQHVSLDAIRKALERASSSLLGKTQAPPSPSERRWRQCWCEHWHCERTVPVEAWDNAQQPCPYLVPKEPKGHDGPTQKCLDGGPHQPNHRLCDCSHKHCNRCGAALREDVPEFLHDCPGGRVVKEPVPED